MLAPVFTVELRPDERVAAVRGFGPVPGDIEVEAEPDDEDPVSDLRKSIVGGVDNRVPDRVDLRRVPTGDPYSVKATLVVWPVLVALGAQGRGLELREDIPQVGGEGRSGERLDILDDEGARPRLTKRPEDLGEEVALIVMSAP